MMITLDVSMVYNVYVHLVPLAANNFAIGYVGLKNLKDPRSQIK